jgi:hypothetical protein
MRGVVVLKEVRERVRVRARFNRLGYEFCKDSQTL